MSTQLTLEETRKILAQALGQKPQPKNRLQPGISQLKVLRPLGSGLNKMTIHKWVQCLKPLLPTLFKGCEEKRPDQLSRANQIVDTLLDHPELVTVVFMDGHGRFTLLLAMQIVERLSKERASKVHFRVCDIQKESDGSQTVTNWHALFGFNNYQAVQGSIFQEKPDTTTFVYLNFCGVGGKEIIHPLFNYIDSVPRKLYHAFMLSFSHIRKARKAHFLNNPVRLLKVGYSKLKNSWHFGKEKSRSWSSVLVTPKTKTGKLANFLTYRFQQRSSLKSRPDIAGKTARQEHTKAVRYSKKQAVLKKARMMCLGTEDSEQHESVTN